MAPWRCIPGWDATSLVAPPDADPDYYEDKKILDSEWRIGGGVQILLAQKKGVVFSYINWKVGAPTGLEVALELVTEIIRGYILGFPWYLVTGL